MNVTSSPFLRVVQLFVEEDRPSTVSKAEVKVCTGRCNYCTVPQLELYCITPAFGCVLEIIGHAEKFFQDMLHKLLIFAFFIHLSGFFQQNTFNNRFRL